MRLPMQSIDSFLLKLVWTRQELVLEMIVALHNDGKKMRIKLWCEVDGMGALLMGGRSGKGGCGGGRGKQRCNKQS